MSKSLLVKIPKFSKDTTGLNCELEAKITSHEGFWYIEELFLGEVDISQIVSEEWLDNLLPRLIKKATNEIKQEIAERNDDDEYFQD